MGWIWAALGGAVGASLRWGVYQWAQKLQTHPITAFAPGAATLTTTGTLLVNLSGSLVIGLLMGLFDTRVFLDERLRTFLIMGVLGGFTTMSALSMEGWQLLRAGHAFKAIMFVTLQTLGCVILAGIGWTLGRLLLGQDNG
ncbi:MAG: CrcB family protein [Planctomycetota bacterium]|nr:CrcB family protein [Planctomycetota bacterium]